MKSPARNYVLTDEMIDILLDRLERFRGDEDAQAVGNEIARQQNFNPNHIDSPGKNVVPDYASLNDPLAIFNKNILNKK